MSHYSSNVKIHPWFILPRGSEIIVSFGCLRAVVTREKALLFDAHRPTNKQHAMRISKSLHCNNGFTFRDGQILFSTKGHKKNENHFELNMVEEIIKEVCTMYLRRVRLYEPIVSNDIHTIKMCRLPHSHMILFSSITGKFTDGQGCE